MSCVIATFNANGLRQTYKRKAVFHYLKQKKDDVILLQETRTLHLRMKIYGNVSGEGIFCFHTEIAAQMG